MSITQILVILLRRGWIMLLALLASLSVAIGVLLMVPGRYDAIATASIDPNEVDPISANSVRSSVALMQGNILSLVMSQRVALDVVRRLNLTANPDVQQSFRQSRSFGRDSIEDWMASSIVRGVDPKFAMGTNVLEIKYKSSDPNQAALLANAFLASTIDGTIAMKAADADQTARWFAPQLEQLRKDLDAARAALTAYESEANMLAPGQGGDSQTSQFMTLSGEVSSVKSQLTTLQTRLASNNTDLSTDPADPDLQILAGLKQRLSNSEGVLEAAKGTLGANNPKMLGEQANAAALRKQIGDATEKLRQHLRERIETTRSQLAALEAQQAEAQKVLIGVQAQRDHMQQLQRDVVFAADQVNAREKAASEAKLKSKLTFSDITVLDKATPPLDPAFPKPALVLPVAGGAGLALGLLLALLAEATDRRVRFPIDLEYAAAAPFLGSLEAVRRIRGSGASTRALRPV